MNLLQFILALTDLSAKVAAEIRNEQAGKEAKTVEQLLDESDERLRKIIERAKPVEPPAP